MPRGRPPSSVKRIKVTLSLPWNVIVALRIAKAESGREMSLIVEDALRSVLKDRLAAQAAQESRR